MSDEELEQEELEAGEEEEGEELSAADEAVGEEDDGSDRVAVSGKKSKNVAEVDEMPSIEAKQKDREALAKAMEEFLARGGKVQEVEPNVVADPPKKPDSKYGSRPI
ncbi:transcriptional regulator SutA [Azotobacter salinestris]|uniref:transcriptional regulator SutA n=1 Tax=Azotobacter salinestris TaxID=69964 RepID=UPI001266A7FB|nr:transcriptional regulator SutA [Azotobacter salinestris]